MSEHVNFFAYQKKVFRAFSTAHPSQNLLDDLCSPQEQSLLESLYYPDQAFAELPAAERSFQRSQQSEIQQEISKKFNPQNWYRSRYSDGSFGVLYSAESEKTALAESLYHKRNFYEEEILHRPVQIDLRLAHLQIATKRAVDLTQNFKLDQKKLSSQDESGYPYCQELAKDFRKKQAQLLRVPSARDNKGVCIPIFDSSAIQKDRGHLKYIKCVFTQEGTEVYTGSELTHS